MGTNLYVRVNECTCCGRYDELHVGKSGHTVQALVRQFPDDLDPTPIGEIRSWSDWKRLLAEVPHTAWDEYGAQLTDDELIQWFEGSKPQNRRRGYDWVHDHFGKPGSYLSQESVDQYSLDGDGFTVIAGEFS